jgi:nitrile hydratase subunit beta
MTLAAGTTVRTRTQRSNGHTRLPHYLQRKRGVIVQFLGSFPLPDDVVANPKAPKQSRLYTVAFPSSSIFEGDGAGTICADLFEDYLEVEP